VKIVLRENQSRRGSFGRIMCDLLLPFGFWRCTGRGKIMQ
jgi:hypothetical protein